MFKKLCILLIYSILGRDKTRSHHRITRSAFNLR